MSNQEAGSEGEFSHNQPTSESSIYEIPAISTAACFATHDQEALQFSDIMNILSDVELPASKISCMTESEDKGESSGTKRKYGEFLEHSQAHSDAGEGFQEKELKISGEIGQSGRSRSAEAHNTKEKLRRWRFKEKLRALQELVPNCSKKDAESTLENATKYIKFLQNQVQMMSMGAGLMSQSHFPSWNQEMRIPNLFPALQVGPRSGVGMGYGMGMYGMPPSINIPMSPLALPSPCSSASSSILRFPVLGGLAQVLPIPPLHFPCDTMSVTSVSSFPSASCAVTQVESSSHGVPCSSFELNTSKRSYK